MVARWFSVNLETFTKGCGFEPHGLRAFLFFLHFFLFVSPEHVIHVEKDDILLLCGVRRDLGPKRDTAKHCNNTKRSVPRSGKGDDVMCRVDDCGLPVCFFLKL
jgi:hypothetical protein